MLLTCILSSSNQLLNAPTRDKKERLIRRVLWGIGTAWVPLFSTAAVIFSFSEELGDKVEEEEIEEVGVKVEEEENDSLVSILGSACRSSTTAGPLPLVPSSSLRVATHSQLPDCRRSRLVASCNIQPAASARYAAHSEYRASRFGCTYRLVGIADELGVDTPQCKIYPTQI